MITAFGAAAVELWKQVYGDADTRELNALLSINKMFRMFLGEYERVPLNQAFVIPMPQPPQDLVPKAGNEAGPGLGFFKGYPKPMNCNRGYRCKKCRMYISVVNKNDLVIDCLSPIKTYYKSENLKNIDFGCGCDNNLGISPEGKTTYKKGSIDVWEATRSSSEYPMTYCMCCSTKENLIFNECHDAQVIYESVPWRNPYELTVDFYNFLKDSYDNLTIRNLIDTLGPAGAATLMGITAGMVTALIFHLYPRKCEELLRNAGSIFERNPIDVFNSYVYPDGQIPCYEGKEETYPFQERFEGPRKPKKTQTVKQLESHEDKELELRREHLDLTKSEWQEQRAEWLSQQIGREDDWADDDFDFDSRIYTETGLDSYLFEALKDQSRTESECIEALKKIDNERSEKSRVITYKLFETQKKMEAKLQINFDKQKSIILSNLEKAKSAKDKALNIKPIAPVAAKVPAKKKKQRRRPQKSKSDEGITKCSKDCPGMKKHESSSPGNLVFKCECKPIKSKDAGLEAKQPGSFATEIAATAAGIHLITKQYDVISSTDGKIGSCFIIRLEGKKLGLVFNNHFLDYAHPHTVIDGKTLNLSIDAPRFRKTDLRCQPVDLIETNSKKFALTVTPHPEVYPHKVYLFTRQNGKNIMSSGVAPKVEPDTSGTYSHCTSDYYSLPCYCGSAISLDQNTVCGIHYHTDGEGKGNNYVPFSPIIVDWFKTL